MKRTRNELSHGKAVSAQRRVRYAANPCPHSSALCARLCRVPSLQGLRGRRQASEPHGFQVRAKRLADDIYKRMRRRKGGRILYIYVG